MIFRFPQYSTEKWNQTCFKTYIYITEVVPPRPHWNWASSTVLCVLPLGYVACLSVDVCTLKMSALHQIARGQHWHKLDLTSYNSARKHVLVQHFIVNRSINYVNRNNPVKWQHLPGTGTPARGDWPSGFELSILALKLEHRARINARMDLFSGWLLLNDHFSLLYFANQHKNRTFSIFHYFVAFFTLSWATPNSVNFPVFPYHWEIVGLA